MTDPNRRLEQAIKQLGADLEPPVGWEARVLAAVEPVAVGPPPRRWWARGWLAIPAVAAIALAVVLLPRPRRAPAPLALSAELVAGSQAVRGPSAIRAVVGGGTDHHAIWIYRDGHELVAQCPGHPACQTTGGALSLVLDVPVGSYQIIGLSSAVVVPAATGSPERDLAAATAGGATWKLQGLEVR
jgi:hypothetical protein